MAWVYSGNEIVKPDTNRAKTVKRMKAVLESEPRLRTDANRLLLESLEAALAPSSAKPGTAERLIDDLTDMCVRLSDGNDRRNADPRYSALAQMAY